MSNNERCCEMLNASPFKRRKMEKDIEILDDEMQSRFGGSKSVNHHYYLIQQHAVAIAICSRVIDLILPSVSATEST